MAGRRVKEEIDIDPRRRLRIVLMPMPMSMPQAALQVPCASDWGLVALAEDPGICLGYDGCLSTTLRVLWSSIQSLAGLGHSPHHVRLVVAAGPLS